MTNGLFLQKETVPQVKQDLVDDWIIGPIGAESKLIICYF